MVNKMTLREIFNNIWKWKFYDDDFQDFVKMREWQELEQRIEFIEKLIEDGLNLEDEFVISAIWKGE